ncbi:hypothetical protein OAJ57_03055 [Alphaproteobacteria bacterium]|nr:hypothetical protein [Alphaproteobacteria bacterium]
MNCTINKIGVSLEGLDALQVRIVIEEGLRENHNYQQKNRQIILFA